MTRIILVVDDEPDLVANCERVLQRAGHVSLRAYTGLEALAVIDRETPDLVVVDLLSRTLNRPNELPLGILTVLLGAPFFLWLLRRNKGLDTI